MGRRPNRPDAPLKVGLVLDDSLDRPDGVQQYVLAVGSWLQAQGHEVHYLASATTRQDVPNIHSLTGNIAVRFNGNCLRIPLPASRRAIHRLLAREQFDVLHVQMPYSPLLAGRVIAAVPPRTVVAGTFHIVPRSWLVRLGGTLLALWCRRTLRRFDAVCSVSPAAQAFASRTFRLSSIIIPNAVPLADFRNAQPFPRSGTQAVRLLFLGRLVARKGCGVLLEAIRLLQGDTALPPFQLTVCGAGPLEARLQRYVAAQHLDGCVRFAGFISEADKRRYYAGADITLFPSSGGESFGIVLVEAAAAGRAAVLAGDNPGYRSVLGECPYNVLFDPLNPHLLADRLRVLLADPAQRQAIAAWQCRHMEQFDTSRVGVRLVREYTAALRRRRDVR